MRYSQLTQRIAGDGAAAWDIHYRALERQARGEDILLLSVGDPDFDTPVPIVQAAIDSLLNGHTHYAEVRGKRSLRQAIAGYGGGAHAELEQVFAQVRQALQPGAARLRPQALYDRPWMLLLGDGRSCMPELMAAASPDAVAHGDSPGSFWRWWLLPKMVVIEIDPRLVEAGDDDTPAGRELSCAWYQALLMLAVPFAVARVPPIDARAETAVVTRAGIAALLRLPVFRRVVLVAALILGSHALHDTFSVIRWRAASVSPQTISVLWSLSVAAEVVVFFVLGPGCCAG